jgi:prepilin-type N-terminal cleavage/methylation domain-containing protein
MSRRAGFSLIEIMAVLIILGVILLSIVPSLDSLVPAYRLKGGAREVASMMELAQSEAVSARKEFQIAYDLDNDTYWLVLPPKPPESDPNAPPSPEAALGGDAPSLTKEGRPKDDVEHGLPPVDPKAQQDDEGTRTDQERDALSPMELPTDVKLECIVIADDEKRSGVVMVPMSYLGGSGSHIVGIKLEHGTDADQAWIKFNALTRTIEFHEERPALRTISGEGQ